MATLSTSFPSKSDEVAVIVPGANPLSVSFTQLNAEIRSFQQKLAKLGIGHGAAVSIALVNSYEFIVCAPFVTNLKRSDNQTDLLLSRWIPERVSRAVIKLN